MNKVAETILVLSFCLLPAGCTHNVYDVEMVHIKGGSYLMGSEGSDADPDESPVHPVYVNDFYLSKYEVTQELWKTVTGRNPSYHKGSRFPVENVSWDDCQAFIEKLNHLTGENYRLPTEEEWEYVASMCYSDIVQENVTDYAWCLASFGDHPRRASSQKVGSLQPDSLGLYDMVGNVNEWCADSYDSLSYQNGHSQEADEKVFRGGCFANKENYLRVRNRNHVSRHIRHYTLGLRLAKDDHQSKNH